MLLQQDREKRRASRDVLTLKFPNCVEPIISIEAPSADRLNRRRTVQLTIFFQGRPQAACTSYYFDGRGSRCCIFNTISWDSRRKAVNRSGRSNLRSRCPSIGFLFALFSRSG